MKRISLYTILAAVAALVFNACQPAAYSPEDVFKTEDDIQAMLDAETDGYIVYGNNGTKHLDDFLDDYMTEKGNKYDLYRTRSEVNEGGKTYYLFSIDTLPVGGKGIYIRGRISTDDYGGNFYKSLVIQERLDDDTQQNLRLSVDMGSASGLYQMGQEIIIRCNGLAVGRYANQPQLCVPSYNNNINANNATEKVGWAPGRIPNGVFRLATKLVGQPDRSKLKYDVVTIADFFTKKDLVEVRKMDGALVKIENIHFTGDYEYNGTLTPCNVYKPGSDSLGIPEKDQYANVFGPTTNNIGFPQSRIIEDGEGNHTLVSTSEYAKYAYYLLPEAEYVGSITGILGFYADNARYATQDYLDGYEWSITPRDIKRYDDCDECIDDIQLKDAEGNAWEPIEFTTNLIVGDEEEDEEEL